VRENEIKLPLPSAEAGRSLLERAGFHLSCGRTFESNLVLDTESGEMRASGRLLRLRRASAEAILTYKGPQQRDRHKSRDEIETRTSDPDAMEAILGQLGYQPAWRYDKFRTEYRRNGEAGHAYLDETPIGVYLELEGPPEWIDAAAQRLGFREQDYILESYGSLYLEHCRRVGIAPGNMIFAVP
jgi:adenylate cyclase class 2